MNSQIVALLQQIAIQLTIANLVNDKKYLTYSEAAAMANNIVKGVRSDGKVY